MDMIQVRSSAIREVGYDPWSEHLRITFAAGNSYDFYGVPQHVFQALLRAASKGSFYNDHIRDRYGVEPAGGRHPEDVADHPA